MLCRGQMFSGSLNAKLVTFLTSFRCWEVYVITGRPFISIVCHHYIRLVIAIGDEPSEDPRGLWIIVWKCFKLHPSVDPQPPQLAAVPPVVDLRGEKEHTHHFDSSKNQVKYQVFKKRLNSCTVSFIHMYAYNIFVLVALYSVDQIRKYEVNSLIFHKISSQVITFK